MKKILWIMMAILTMAFSESNTTAEVTLDGLTLGMDKEKVLAMKSLENAKVEELSYIEKMYYRANTESELQEHLEKGFYTYKTKIADEDAIVWLWFSDANSKLYAMRVEWRNPPRGNLYNIKKDVSEILSRKYGKSEREVWTVGDVKIIGRLSRVSIDGMYFRNLVTFTYIDTDLKKEHDATIVPYQRSSKGL